MPEDAECTRRVVTLTIKRSCEDNGGCLSTESTPGSLCSRVTTPSTRDFFLLYTLIYPFDNTIDTTSTLTEIWINPFLAQQQGLCHVSRPIIIIILQSSLALKMLYCQQMQATTHENSNKSGGTNQRPRHQKRGRDGNGNGDEQQNEPNQRAKWAAT